MLTCPYNAIHVVRKEEFLPHVLVCPDKQPIESFYTTLQKVDHRDNQGNQSFDKIYVEALNTSSDWDLSESVEKCKYLELVFF